MCLHLILYINFSIFLPLLSELDFKLREIYAKMQSDLYLLRLAMNFISAEVQDPVLETRQCD